MLPERPAEQPDATQPATSSKEVSKANGRLSDAHGIGQKHTQRCLLRSAEELQFAGASQF